MSFAIIETGGKQYKVSASKILEIEKLNAKVGETVKFKNVLISKLSDPKKLKQSPENFEAQLDSALKVKGYGHIKRETLKAAILALQ